MTFRIRFGVPEMEELWQRLRTGASANTLSEEDNGMHKKWREHSRSYSQKAINGR